METVLIILAILWMIVWGFWSIPGLAVTVCAFIYPNGVNVNFNGKAVCGNWKKRKILAVGAIGFAVFVFIAVFPLVLAITI